MSNDNLTKLKDYFENNNAIELAFLFGSQAKEKAIKESDFDIAIWPKEGTSEQKLNTISNEIEALVKSNVDLVILPKARPTIAWAAMRGEPLAIKDKKLFVKNMLEVSTEAEDIQDFNLELFKLRQKLRGQTFASSSPMPSPTPMPSL